MSESVRESVFRTALSSVGAESKLARIFILLVVILLAKDLWPLSGLAHAARAQTTSTIEGTVRDAHGAVVSGAQVKVSGNALVAETTALTNSQGSFRITALPAGNYSLTVSHDGFTSAIYQNLEVTLNRILTFDVTLQVGQVQAAVTVNADTPLLERSTSATGGTISFRQIQDLPVNGRNYLGLLELVPGVAVFRQADPGPLAVSQGATDNSTPILGERGGNTNFLIDGLPNKDNVNGGPASQFNQDTIAEFQVLTTGYKPSSASASSAIVNVITKSGTNEYHGVGSLFHRNNVFDSSDIAGANVPFLLRWTYSLALGGPVAKDKVFFFGSSERIDERRRLNFQFPVNTPVPLIGFESKFDRPTTDFETRNFLRFDEKLGRHSISEQVNYTNTHVSDFLPLALATNLPSTRENLQGRHLLLGFSDTFLLGNQGNPWVIVGRAGYRGEPTAVRPANPDAGPFTFFSIFDGTEVGRIGGNLGTITFGDAMSPFRLDQEYVSLELTADKLVGRQDLKFGWNFLRTNADGIESLLRVNQLFATARDFEEFGPINAGFYTLNRRGGLTPNASDIHLTNSHNGAFFQDDLKLRHNLTLSAGLRWDYDDRFPNKANFSPRIGAAWAVSPKTVIRGQFGVFYDQYRVGLARDIPGFGGADIRGVQDFSYPRLFYGVPTIVPQLVGLCLSPNMTDAQIAAGGSTCHGPIAPSGTPIYGIDHLNGLVAPGHRPIPAGAVVTIANVQSLTGLTPDQFLSRVDAATGKPNGFWYWGALGSLTEPALPPSSQPIIVDPRFRTPHTLSYTIGVQREVAKNTAVEIQYYYRDIRDILGLRISNLEFISRIPGHARTFTPGSPTQNSDFGPWFSGTYNGFSISVNKRFSNRFMLGSSYSFAHEIDNNLGGIVGLLPSDNFIGVPPIVTDPISGKTNATGPFVASNGNPVPQAGKFYNGPDLDKGQSPLSINHIFQVNGLVELPWRLQVSAIFNAQSGFHFSKQTTTPINPDGSFAFNSSDLNFQRGAFTAPPFVNLDLRIAKLIRIGERVRTLVLFEFFNLLNNANPAAVQQFVGQPSPFGKATQVLPGREGQVGIRIQF